MKTFNSHLLSFGIGFLGLCGFIDTAGAVDGVIEINQACAVNTGCVSGDTSGFPVTISSEGSYRLTSSLILTAEQTNTDLITITSPDVTIDLNGFELFGACKSSTPPCSPLAGNDGVFSNSPRITVKNGTIRNMMRNAITLGPQARVENIRALANANVGISLGGTSPHGSIIRLNHVADNGSHGINSFGTSIIEKNTIVDNSKDGIFLGIGGNLVADNVITNNGDDGISSPNSGNNVLRDNVVSFNGGNGITSQGTPDKTGNLVTGNTITQNTGTGLLFDSTENGYANNVIQGNGSTVTSGTEIGTNLCNSNTTCP